MKRGDTGFEMRAVRHELEVVDMSAATIRTHHRFDLRATREERFFRRQYTWTGSGIEKTPVVTSGRDELGHANHKLHGPVVKEGKTRHFLVDLGRWLSPGDVERVEINHTFIDLGHTLLPFIGFVARPGCESIGLSLRLPDAMVARVKAAELQADSDVQNRVKLLEPVIEKSSGENRRRYDWDIPHPVAGTNYRILWEI